MLYLILIGLSLILFGGFLLLTAFERSRGMRMAGIARNRLDAHMARLSFIIAHVDWSAFAKHLAGSLASRVMHDVTHAILVLVRSLERILTRTVKGLREKRENPGAVAVEEMSLQDRAMVRVKRALAYAKKTRTRASRKRNTPISKDTIE
ncbi:MAG: hypothetical protein AB199_04000 [Parcubacteria bacterium C7867-004]|nr:MAG: hypothetical protein AB199_04000 [Parcubacteria bacterium C7867-004]